MKANLPSHPFSYRYLLRFGRILQRLELDAFLAMSVSPLLHDVQTMQDLKVCIQIWQEVKENLPKTIATIKGYF